MKNKKNTGFTLIEILVVIGIIAILAAIVIIAINPAKQFAQARNTERTAGVNAILNAIGQRIADNKGIFEGKFTVGEGASAEDYFCGKIPNDTVSPINFTSILTTPGDIDDIDDETGKLGCLVPTYISALPVDPTWVSGSDTLYTINMNETGRITVCAPLGDEAAVPDSEEICVTR